MIEKRFDLECKKLFNDYKVKIFNNTNLSMKNKRIDIGHFPYFNETLEEFQADLANKLISLHQKMNPNDPDSLENLQSIGETYEVKFLNLMEDSLNEVNSLRNTKD